MSRKVTFKFDNENAKNAFLLWLVQNADSARQGMRSLLNRQGHEADPQFDFSSKDEVRISQASIGVGSVLVRVDGDGLPKEGILTHADRDDLMVDEYYIRVDAGRMNIYKRKETTDTLISPSYDIYSALDSIRLYKEEDKKRAEEAASHGLETSDGDEAKVVELSSNGE